MVCLYCGGETQVVNSRPQQKLKQVWRRRKCVVCGSIFTTSERIDLTKSLLIRKSNQKLEGFTREKLLLSIYTSLGHRKNAVSDSIAITETIVSRLLKSINQPIVDVETLIKLSHDVLRHFDTAASVHYNAYYPIKTNKPA